MPVDNNGLDRLVRLLLWVSDTSESGLAHQSRRKQKGKLSRSRRIDLTVRDFVDAHAVSSAKFGDVSWEYIRQMVKNITDYPAFSVLDEGARRVAFSYIFSAHMADILSTSSNYWILDGTGPLYPYPLGIRTGQLPRWKRPRRSLDKIRKNLNETMAEVLRLESDVVGSRPEQMPSQLMIGANLALGREIAWMHEFPSSTELRSVYRKSMQANLEADSPEAVAYVLDRLYREHAIQPPKIKQIECHIAEIQTRFLQRTLPFILISEVPQCGLKSGRRSIRNGEIRSTGKWKYYSKRSSKADGFASSRKKSAAEQN